MYYGSSRMLLRRSPHVKLVYPAQIFRKTETARPDGALGLLYLAGKLRDNGIEVSVLDMGVGEASDSLASTYENRVVVDNEHVRVGISLNLLKEKLVGYDIVGVSSIFTPQTYNAFEVAQAAKQVNPEVLTIAGGGNARALKELFLSNGFDLVVCGEGEQTLLDLCRKLERGEDYRHLPNLAYMQADGTVVVNPEGPVLIDLDQLPMPAWDLLNLPRYWKIAEPHGGTFKPGNTVRYLSMQTSRGCPYRCSYCHISREGEAARLRVKGVDRVLKEISRIQELGAEYLFFEDDSLLANRSRIFEIFSSLRKVGLKIIDANGVNLAHFFRRQGNQMVVDTELLELMCDVGWIEVALPFESGSQRILDRYASKKWNIARYDVGALVRAAAARGIKVYGFFTIGYPDETLDELTDTVLLAQKMVGEGLSSANFYIINPYPGSALYDEAAVGGYLPSELDLVNMKFQVPTMIGTTIPQEVLQYTRRLAYELIHSSELLTSQKSRTVAGVAESSGRLQNLF
jgi:radical SAM superfamily enzyme YgiQ (UPF0313 family)